MHTEKADADRIYLPYQEDGRGLMNLERVWGNNGCTAGTPDRKLISRWQLSYSTSRIRLYTQYPRKLRSTSQRQEQQMTSMITNPHLPQRRPRSWRSSTRETIRSWWRSRKRNQCMGSSQVIWTMNHRYWKVIPVDEASWTWRWIRWSYCCCKGPETEYQILLQTHNEMKSTDKCRLCHS